MNRKTPLVSIIVPVYKTKTEYLRVCLESILGQSHRALELILVDDGSPDSCGAVCDAYAARDSRIRVIHQENRGVSAARNTGLCMASGEYLMFVDADDWIETDCVETVLQRALEQNADLLLFQSFTEFPGKTVAPKETTAGMLTPGQRKEIKLRILINENSYDGFEQRTVWGKLIKKSCLTEENQFPEGLVQLEDMIFNLLLLEKTDSVFQLNYIGYHYRMNPRSITHQYDPGALSIALDVAAAFDRYLKTFHKGDREYLDALGEGLLKQLVIIEEKYTFHKDSRLKRKEIIAVSKEYMRSDTVRKYALRCRLKSCKSVKGKLRYLLQSGRCWNLYYCIMKLAKGKRG